MHGREAKESGKFFVGSHLHHPTNARGREGRADNLIMKSLLVVRLLPTHPSFAQVGRGKRKERAGGIYWSFRPWCKCYTVVRYYMRHMFSTVLPGTKLTSTNHFLPLSSLMNCQIKIEVPSPSFPFVVKLLRSFLSLSFFFRAVMREREVLF